MRIIWELSSEIYHWELSSENYEWELSSENYHLVYHHAEKLRFIGILAYPKIEVCGSKILRNRINFMISKYIETNQRILIHKVKKCS